MTDYSYNGWSASPNLKIRRLEVAGESFAPGVRDDDDVYAVLKYVAEQLHRRVEPIVKSGWHHADDWGFNFRKNRNSNNLSNHSSGTAFDYNATRHPNGVRNSWTNTQIAEIKRILAEVKYTVACGEFYNSTTDGMHFEINVRPGNSTLKAVAAAIRKLGPGERLSSSPASSGEAPKGTPAGSLKVGSSGPAVQRLQKGLNAAFPGYAKYAMNRKAGNGNNLLATDGDFGKITEAWVKEFQRRSKLKADGIVGPATKKELASYGVKI